MRHGYPLPRLLLARHHRPLLHTACLNSPITRSLLPAYASFTPIPTLSRTAGFTVKKTNWKEPERRRRPKKENGEWSLRKQAVGHTFADLLYLKDLDAAIDAFPAAQSGLTQVEREDYVEHIKNAFDKDNVVTREKLSTAVNDIASGLVAGTLEYDPSTLEKTLHFFRRLHDHQGALSLWRWAREAGKPLTLGVYSTIIQIVTDGPIKMDLAEMESIYQEAISNDGGSFADYYLSHNAILADRDSDSVTTQLHLRALHLLSAIARARLLNDNWQDGYLAYDSMCRLSPSRPKLFYQALVSKDSYRPVPEVYRIVKAAVKEGIELNPSPRNRLIPRIFALLEPITQKIETNAQLLVITRIISSLVDLMVSQPESKLIGLDMTKILTLLLNLTNRQRLPNAANHPGWQEYTLAVATAGQEFLQTFISQELITGSIQIPHTMVMKLAINANNPEMFQTTLNRLFERGEAPNADVALALVEAAGRFGTLNEIKPAWNELVSIRKEAQGKDMKLNYWDLSALRSAVAFTPTDDALQFLLEECRNYSFPKLALLTHQDKETPSTLDLPGAQSLITSIFEKASQTLTLTNLSDTTSPPTSSLPQPSPHTTSLTHQPLASPETMYLLYDELTSDQPTPSPTIPYADLPNHPILHRRFLSWSTSTALLADADSYSRLQKVLLLKRQTFQELKDAMPKSSSKASDAAAAWAAKEAAGLEADVFRAFLMGGVDGDVKVLERLEGSPRFGDLDELRGFVRRIRMMDGDDGSAGGSV